MSEEEKKAIEYLKTYMLPYFGEGKEVEFYLNDVLINLIKRQQKEIEELKYKLEIEKIDNKYNQEERDEETIPRYKIRKK